MSEGAAAAAAAEVKPEAEPITICVRDQVSNE